MNTRQFLRRCLVWPALLALALAAGCGGGSGDAGDSASASIGPAGGTVATASGAQVVIPAGALAAPTTITIERADAGAPVLPQGFVVGGGMFAFTPHGTTFSAPVMVSLPVDLSAMPAGLTPTLYKTNAAGQWERVPGATLSGSIVTAQVTSFSFGLFGASPPQITQQPQNASVNTGGTAAFSVTALGSPPFAYEWQLSRDAGVTWRFINGATARSHTTAAALDADNGTLYRVIVSNPDGPAQSQPASLTVTPQIIAPAITTQPANTTVAVGASATFSVVASGSPSLYQWEISRDAGVNFSPVSGANNASFTHANAQLADTGVIYRVLVSNGAGNVTSASAALAVAAAPPPPSVGTWVQLGGALDILPANQTAGAAVALDLTGNPVVAWAEYGASASGTIGIRVARWDGANWVALGGDLGVYRGPFPRSFEAPSIAIDPTTGHPVVAWSETRGGQASLMLDWNVIVKRWTGSAWQQLGAALNIAPAEGARVPKVRVTNAGALIVAWWETPHFTAARQWDAAVAAWVAFGGQNVLGPHVTGAQDLGNTALTIDNNGDPIVLRGSASGVLAARGTGAGWSYIGFPVDAGPASARSWGAAVDTAGRPLALVASSAAVTARRFEGGAWADLGAALFTAGSATSAFGAEIAVPFGTPTVIASWYVLTLTVGSTTTVAHSFRQWDGAAWHPLAPDLPHTCQLAVRAAAGTPATAAPVAACVRGPGADQDIVVYRLAP